jgi:hypothetical protein
MRKKDCQQATTWISNSELRPEVGFGFGSTKIVQLKSYEFVDLFIDFSRRSRLTYTLATYVLLQESPSTIVLRFEMCELFFRGREYHEQETEKRVGWLP